MASRGARPRGRTRPLLAAFYQALEPLVGDRKARLPSCSDLEAKRCGGEDVARSWRAASGGDRGHPGGDRAPRRDGASPGRPAQAVAGAAGRPRAEARAGAPRMKRSTRSPGGTEGAFRSRSGSPPARARPSGVSSAGSFFTTTARAKAPSSSRRRPARIDQRQQGGRGVPAGLLPRGRPPDSRLLAVGGICEDAMAGVCAGLGAFGHHIGVASSYAPSSRPSDTSRRACTPSEPGPARSGRRAVHGP